MTEQQSRRERHVAHRRRQILEAAAAVFAEQGFHRATTKAIAAAADVAEGTIYNYFQSKDDLVIGILDQLAQLDERREVLEQALREDLRAFFTRFLADRLQVVRQNETLLAAVLPEVLTSPDLQRRYREALVRPGIALLEEHLAARREAGQLPPIDITITSRLVTALLLGLELLTLVGEESTTALWSDTAALAQVIAAFVFDGFTAVRET